MEEDTEDYEEDEDDEDFDEDDEDLDEDDATRELVVPGEVLTDDLEHFQPGRGTIVSKGKIISLHIGLKNINKNYVNVIPLRGIYTPRPGDKVIAIVTDKNPVKYRCDINAKDEAQLKPKNTVRRFKSRLGRKSYNKSSPNTEKYDIGEVLVAKVVSADRLNKPELTTVGKYLGKKNNGLVITIDPPKIPRVIGRSGSMIKMLKRQTHCNIFVTQNGRIWLSGESIDHERLLIEAIHKIEKEAHTTGLTDRVETFLENEKTKRGIE
ncbi:MAG: RNA-binding protein [Candidatus Lokiarchaeota archaeon]|nr:RNA-binding protein [Candidatus Lokiarchaeota archaeon]MBD3338684.1 RNA-binding protein [Candidatus Lokiarchaeota archaeon]